MKIDENLTAKIEPFDTFWEAPEDVEKGFNKFLTFYKHNYGRFLPKNKDTSFLVVSCGAGYFVNYLNKEGYHNVVGIDSDEDKLSYAIQRGLNCKHENAFGFLTENPDTYDAIFVEQEINHLTKQEIIEFLNLCRRSLRNSGILMVHSLNGANPITGSEALAQNFDHYNTLTEYSLTQVLSHTGFGGIRVFPLKLYVFYTNPLNYVGIVIDLMLTAVFKLCFTFYGKKNNHFSKKIGAIAEKS